MLIRNFFQKTTLQMAVVYMVSLLASASVSAVELTKANIEKALGEAYVKYKGLQEGANADYIPALAKVDSSIYGIAVVTADGQVYSIGDIKSEVSIQSISKVF